MPKEMRTIILTKGIPASGKSTWAMEEIRRYPGKYKRVNKDLLREMTDSSEFSLAKEKFILDVRDYIVEKALCKDFDVIVDDTNFSDKHFQSMCAIAKKIGNVRVFEKFFDIPLQEALDRNAKRPNPVPPGVIEDMWKKNVSGKHIVCRDEYFPNIPRESRRLLGILSDKPACVIVDIDGTLAINESSRSYYDYTRVLEDSPNTDIVFLVKDMSRDFKIVLVSGREDTCRADTEQWLKIHGISYDDLFMRKAKDFRDDRIVKEEIYRKSVEPKYHVTYIIDDRPKVCQMWRNIGLCVLQVDDRPF